MIIVTGATGNLGGQIVERLLERVPAEQIGVSVRDPEKAREIAERGVRVRRGDFDDPASMAHAFEGASRVLIVSSNSNGETAVRQNRTAIEAAREVGAQRVFYTSHIGSDPISAFPPMMDHDATEVVLRDSGVAFTVLRNGFYAATVPLLFLGSALESGELAVPEDGPVNWTTHADLAEAIAIALSDEALTDTVLNLTAAEAMDMDAVAEIASELTGRQIRRVVVSDEEYRAGLLAQGFPEQAADSLLGIFIASRQQRRFTLIDRTLERLIGRPPVSMREFLKAEIS